MNTDSEQKLQNTKIKSVYIRANQCPNFANYQLSTINYKTMLTSIVLKLQLDHNASLHHHLGRANYAETLARLQTLDYALGKEIHDFDGPKPLTCSSLLNVQANREGTPIQANKPYYIRVTLGDQWSGF